MNPRHLPRCPAVALLALAAAVLSAVSATAQVYSINAVGYVNITFHPGLNLFASPLSGASNTVAEVLGAVPEGTILYKYHPQNGWVVNFYTFGVWSNPTMTLTPGEGAQLMVPGSADFTVTFIGEILQGNLANPLSPGFSLLGSIVPQAGKLQTDLQFNPSSGDVIYRHLSGEVYGRFDYADGGGWSPSEPELQVGEGFILSNHVAATSWTRTFVLPDSKGWADIGLRVFDGASVCQILCELPNEGGTPTSPLRIARNGTIYGVALVERSSPLATPMRVNTSAGIRAWARIAPDSPPRLTGIRRHTGGTLVVEWVGGGTLQTSADVLGAYVDAPGATSPYTLIPNQAAQFFRVRQ